MYIITCRISFQCLYFGSDRLEYMRYDKWKCSGVFVIYTYMNLLVSYKDPYAPALLILPSLGSQVLQMLLYTFLGKECVSPLFPRLVIFPHPSRVSWSISFSCEIFLVPMCSLRSFLYCSYCTLSYTDHCCSLGLRMSLYNIFPHVFLSVVLAVST